MTEELLWGIIYSVLGLACFFMARRAKKLRNEWRQIKDEMNNPPQDSDKSEDSNPEDVAVEKISDN